MVRAASTRRRASVARRGGDAMSGSVERAATATARSLVVVAAGAGEENRGARDATTVGRDAAALRDTGGLDGEDAECAAMEARVGPAEDLSGHVPDGAESNRKRPRFSGKSPPLREEQITTLSEADRRRALARWNARLRGLKRRIDTIAEQFPTSSIVLLFTKPFRTKERQGKWCERKCVSL